MVGSWIEYMANTQRQMAMIVIPFEEWQCQQARLERVEGILTEQKKDASGNEWVSSTEARKLLKVSPRTWQQYRNNRVIPFTQFGRKIMVKKADIEAFLQSHSIKNMDII